MQNINIAFDAPNTKRNAKYFGLEFNFSYSNKALSYQSTCTRVALVV